MAQEKGVEAVGGLVRESGENSARYVDCPSILRFIGAGKGEG